MRAGFAARRGKYACLPRTWRSPARRTLHLLCGRTAHLVSEQGWVRLEGRSGGPVGRVVLRGLDEHELEREHDGVDAEHRSPVLAEYGQRHESGV